jgi:hypothetical protein
MICQRHSARTRNPPVLSSLYPRSPFEFLQPAHSCRQQRFPMPVMGLWGSTVDSVVLIVTPERNWPKLTPELRLCVSVHVLLCQTWLDDDSASTTTFFRSGPHSWPRMTPRFQRRCTYESFRLATLAFQGWPTRQKEKM